MKSVPMVIRKAVLADCDARMGTWEVSIKYSVSAAWVRRLKQRRRETGEIAPRSSAKKSPPKWRAYESDALRGRAAESKIEEIMESQPDITLRELREVLGVTFSLQTLSTALRTLKYSFKKRSSMPPSKTARTSRRVERSGV